MLNMVVHIVTTGLWKVKHTKGPCATVSCTCWPSSCIHINDETANTNDPLLRADDETYELVSLLNKYGRLWGKKTFLDFSEGAPIMIAKNN